MVVEFVCDGDRVARLTMPGSCRPLVGDTVARGETIYRVVSGLRWSEQKIGNLEFVFATVEVEAVK